MQRNKVAVYKWSPNSDKTVVFYGTIEDVRKFAKSYWGKLTKKAKLTLVTIAGVTTEEEYFHYIDGHIGNVMCFMAFEMDFDVVVICHVPIEDFETFEENPE